MHELKMTIEKARGGYVVEWQGTGQVMIRAVCTHLGEVQALVAEVFSGAPIATTQPETEGDDHGTA